MGFTTKASESVSLHELDCVVPLATDEIASADDCAELVTLKGVEAADER